MPNHTRSLLVVLSTLFLLGVSVGASAAQTPAAHLTAIQAKGDADITARLTSLSGLVTNVSAATKLSTAQKSSLTTEMQGETTSLTKLKTTLDAETTVAAATTDFKNIFAQHYIFAFYQPRVERIIAADKQSDAATLLTALVPKLQAYITQAQTAGKDVTALQTSLTEMQAKAAEAQTKADGVIATLTPLTASGYPANKTTVQSAGTDLKASRADLKTASADAHSIVTGLRKLIPSAQ